MITALGTSESSFAGFRAGMARFEAAKDFETFTQGQEQSEPLDVSQIPVVTQGFCGVGRFTVMTLAALRDLSQRCDLTQINGHVPVVMALPDPWDRQIQRAEFKLDQPEQRINAFGAAVWEAVSNTFKTDLQLRPPRFFGGSVAAFARALATAREIITTGGAQQVLLLAADCLLENGTLEHLQNEGFLKYDGNPDGLVPAEAAVALLLTAASEEDGMLVKTGFVTDDGQPDDDDDAEDSEEEQEYRPPPTPYTDGRRLFQLTEPLTPHWAKLAPEQCLLHFIADLAGPKAMAVEFANYQVLCSAFPVFQVDNQVFTPAESFGYALIANQALAVVLAWRELQAASGHPLSFLSASIDPITGERSLIWLGAPAANRYVTQDFEEE